MLKQIVISILFILIVVSCAVTPLGRKQFAFLPADELNAMGIEAFNQMKETTPTETDPATVNYVLCVSNSIVAVTQSDVKNWEVGVFQDDTANAFALPGGKMGVHTGLLKVARNQHQLATVLGHEVGHVLASHGNERMSQNFALEQGLGLLAALANVQSEQGKMILGALGVGAQFGILLPYSRLQESEADELGLYLMAQAGFDPRESVTLWQNMSQAGGEQPPEFLSTHPSHSTRISGLQQSMPKALNYYQSAQSQGRRPNCS